MTTSQLEHLRLLLAHLDKLLDIAKERTPGEWKAFQACGSICVGDLRQVTCIQDIEKGLHLEILGKETEHDATFIASCAGNAEAGWRATREAIQSLLEIQAYSNQSPTHIDGICPYGCDTPSIAEKGLESILSAWPIEMLTK